jgi:hypothetical protein
LIPAIAPGLAREEEAMEQGSRAVEGTKEMLLSWFGDDELEVCPRCHQKQVLPVWGSATGRICVTSGILSTTEKAEVA